MARTCIIDRCNGVHKGKGLCGKHHLRLFKYGHTDCKNPRIKREANVCKINGCDGDYYAKDYCKKHWIKNKKYGDANYKSLLRFKNETGICSINGCNNKYLAKKYCSKHYQRFHKHGDVDFNSRTGRHITEYLGYKYWKIKCPCHPKKMLKDYVFEHRLVMEVSYAPI